MKETGARRGYDERRFLNQVLLVVHNSVSGVGVGYDHRSGHVPGSGGQHFADPGPKRRLRSGTPTRVTLAPPRIKKKSKSGNEFLETQKNKQTNKQTNNQTEKKRQQSRVAIVYHAGRVLSCLINRLISIRNALLSFCCISHCASFVFVSDLMELSKTTWPSLKPYRISKPLGPSHSRVISQSVNRKTNKQIRSSHQCQKTTIPRHCSWIGGQWWASRRCGHPRCPTAVCFFSLNNIFLSISRVDFSFQSISPYPTATRISYLIEANKPTKHKKKWKTTEREGESSQPTTEHTPVNTNSFFFTENKRMDVPLHCCCYCCCRVCLYVSHFFSVTSFRRFRSFCFAFVSTNLFGRRSLSHRVLFVSMIIFFCRWFLGSVAYVDLRFSSPSENETLVCVGVCVCVCVCACVCVRVKYMDSFVCVLSWCRLSLFPYASLIL